MNNKYTILIVAFMAVIFPPSRGFSLKEDTHKAINEYLAQNSVINRLIIVWT